MRTAKHPQKRKTPRGASAVYVRERKIVPGAVVKGWSFLAGIPWLRCFVHLSIFGFWLVVLTVLMKGAEWLDHPIGKIEVSGTFQYLQEDRIKAELAPFLRRGFFSIKLDEVQAKLETLPWIEQVSLSRHWPGILKVSLTEKVPVAHWNSSSLLTAQGDVFTPRNAESIEGIPYLHGGTQPSEVLTQYRQWQEQLNKVNLTIESLILEPRGAWRIGFEEGWVLNLGKQNVVSRLDRFIKIYGKRLYQEANKIRAVDARYTQGVAVTWKESATPEES